jgi:curli biogenesis system outer membrane secretion channel CsgG
MKKFVALVVAALAAVSLTACSSSPTSTTPAPTVTVTQGAPTEADSYAQAAERVWAQADEKTRTDVCSFLRLSPDLAAKAFMEGVVKSGGTTEQAVKSWEAMSWVLLRECPSYGGQSA